MQAVTVVRPRQSDAGAASCDGEGRRRAGQGAFQAVENVVHAIARETFEKAEGFREITSRRQSGNEAQFVAHESGNAERFAGGEGKVVLIDGRTADAVRPAVDDQRAIRQNGRAGAGSFAHQHPVAPKLDLDRLGREDFFQALRDHLRENVASE